MAIIIPSKNIYEINNQKVVDNEVDNVEVSAKNASLINDYSTIVYNQDYSADEIEEKTFVQTNKGDNLMLGTGGGSTTYIRLAATSELKLKYKTIPQIKIPKIKNSVFIEKILYKTENDGNEEIKYSITGELKKYGWFGIGYSPKDNLFNFYDGLSDWENELETSTRATSYKDIGEDYIKTETLIPEYPQLTAEQYCKVIGNEIQTRSYIHGFDTRWSSSYQNSAEAIINQTPEQHLVLDYDKDIEETEDFYTIKNVKFCVGVENRLGYAYLTSSTPFDNIGEQGGLYVRGRKVLLTPSSISITIYGDTITLDLQDETVKIGDGQHVYSFNGNELMQTSNQLQSSYGISIRASIKDEGGYSYYPIEFQPQEIHEGDIFVYKNESATCVIIDGKKTLRAITDGQWSTRAGIMSTVVVKRLSFSQIQDTYNNVIKEWKNGKETATIRCAIADYFGDGIETGNTTIRIDDIIPRSPTEANITFMSEKLPRIEHINSLSVSISGQTYSVTDLTFSSNRYSGKINLSADNIRQYQEYGATFTTKTVVSANDKYFPQTIQIGDMVLPYIMAANGKDKPMSLTINGTVKPFVVIGKRIIFDGMVQQELTLQEYTFPNLS